MAGLTGLEDDGVKTTMSVDASMTNWSWSPLSSAQQSERCVPRDSCGPRHSSDITIPQSALILSLLAITIIAVKCA